MQQMWMTVKESWIKLHQFHKKDGTIKRQSRSDLILVIVSLFFFYTLLTAVVVWLSSQSNRLVGQNNTGGALWTVFAAIMGICLLSLSCRSMVLKTLFKDDRARRKIKEILSDWVATILTSLELLFVYLVVTAWLPIQLNLSSSKLNWQSSAVYLSIIILFMVGQPVFEGYLIRGLFTRLLKSVHVTGTTHRQVLYYWIPVFIGSILHMGGSLNFAMFLFVFIQNMAYQLIAEKQGLRNSIGVNICFNVIIASLL